MKHWFSTAHLNPSNSHSNGMTWFKVLAVNFYDSGAQKLVFRINRYLENAVTYVEN